MAKPAPLSEQTTVPATPAERTPGPVLRRVAGPVTWADERVGAAGLGKFFLRKIFPDHWSFLLGEIALYSFIILLITGVYLTIWFKPSMAEVEYEGSYQLLRGLAMSEAYESTLHISFDIRGGLLMRQMHHWSAMLFVASMFAHMLRVFFTGAFRKPRELNWVIGVALLALGTIEGFAGYSLPDDLLSGTGLRFVDGLIRSIPVIGTWAEFFVFGGEFPGTLIISRLYMVHILLIPGLLLALIAAHMALLVYHKHTQYPGPGRTDQNVVGYPLFPVYMAKAGGFFFIVFGVTTLMGAFMQINPLWTYGPYNPAQVTAGSQPDWYMGWVEGAIRIMPGWESHWGSTTWSWNVVVPGVGLMGLLFTLLGVYPWIEAWLTGDKREHHVLERPRTNPTRTAFGVAGITAYIMLMLGGGNDIIATQFRMSLNNISLVLRVAVFVAPVLAFLITKRICIALTRVDQERLLHGSESGIINRSPAGGYSEDHLPISQGEAFTLTSHNEYPVLESEEISPRQAKARRFFYGDNMSKPTRAELEAAAHHADGHDGDHELGDGDHHAVTGSRQPELTGGKD
ncbi:ubiquinol-cytochrome c reductase cytochrome b subunit [Auraticoccus sp. F435]|uniref:Cytochrome bc1 complex cytochrome b subunit n=1 Tax=Auraticoccus cholistanensis TaxID=2656650 RepID=A0A6A9V1K6_9ACTN|nr:ubiquinol-cytochrome c reductase cytochrome b subunit [Auraticoccus cholistanensis]MVA77360.1 ubiquinol-cytochrome c reductase cytochrome b subunit [Auraticoccus cholistanensis]